MLHGMRRDEIDAALPEIVDFSELRDAIDHPVKTYSSGMAVRLGFACAVYVQPDILIVDEALSVGDAYFQNKCLHKIRAMLDQGTSFIYVTHSADAIRSLCNQGLWLEKGKVRMAGASSAGGRRLPERDFPPPGARRLRQTAGADDPLRVEPAADGAPTTHGRRRSPTRVAAAHRKRGNPGRGRQRDRRRRHRDRFGRDRRAGAHPRVVPREVAPPPGAVLNVGVTDNAGRQILHFNPMF